MDLWFDRSGIPINDMQEVERLLRDMTYKRVARSKVISAADPTKSFDISTVWLGLDHSHCDGIPMIFETMVFAEGSSMDLDCHRYSTEEQARGGMSRWSPSWRPPWTTRSSWTPRKATSAPRRSAPHAGGPSEPDGLDHRPDRGGPVGAPRKTEHNHAYGRNEGKSVADLVIINPVADPASPAARRGALLSMRTRTGHTLGALVMAWLGEQADSEHTRESYRRQLNIYLDWCISRDLDPLTVGLPEITMYGVHLASMTSPTTKRPYKPNTRANMLAAVSSWYTYLVRADVLKANPAKDLKRPKYDRTHSPTSSLDRQQATAVQAKSETGTPRTLTAECVTLIFGLLVDLGIRVSEGCGANLDDLGQKKGKRIIAVRMKGSKMRDRVIPPELGAKLDTYLAARPAPAPGNLDADRALLLTRDGRRVSRHQVFRLVQRMAALAGVPMPHRITPHSLRHTWNTIARELGATLEDRRDALGHSSAAVTQLYDHVADELERDPSTLVAAALAGGTPTAHASRGVPRP
jgi:site-specific recombinase XerD